MKTNKIDLYIGLVAIILGIFLFYGTFSFPPPLQKDAPGPALFPRICLVVILFFALVLIFENLFLRQSGQSDFKLHHKQFLIVTVSLVLYLLVLPYLGFVIASLLYLIPSLLVRMDNRIRTVWVSCVIIAVLYVIFAVILKIKLPTLGF